jgi:hypothetical protein
MSFGQEESWCRVEDTKAVEVQCRYRVDTSRCLAPRDVPEGCLGRAGRGSPVKESHGALQHVNAASMCFCSHTDADSCLAEMIPGAPLHFPTVKYLSTNSAM